MNAIAAAIVSAALIGAGVAIWFDGHPFVAIMLMFVALSEVLDVIAGKGSN